MSRWLLRVFLCLVFATPVFSSPIDQGLINDWKPKKFRAAIRRVQGENGLGLLDGSRENYLHRAVRLDRPEHLALLLENEELQQVFMGRNREALTALELSLLLGRTDCFLVLLPYLLNPNLRIPNSYKWTLVQLAARYNRSAEIRALVARGADVNAVDMTWQRWTALDIALHANAHEAVAVLRELGAQERAPTNVEPLRVHPQHDQLHYDLVRDTNDNEDEILANRAPLSDFSFGPAAIRFSSTVLILFFLANQLGFAGGGASQ